MSYTLCTYIKGDDTIVATSWIDDEGRLHRRDGPAIVRSIFSHGRRLGTESEWWFHGEQHRIETHSDDYTYIREWCQVDHHHFENVHETSDLMTKIMFYRDGVLHREKGPAVTIVGTRMRREWWVDGTQIRVDDPKVPCNTPR